ncbi:MAG: PDZ domain-containing protein, partial [Aquaticitalea sp.]
IGTSAYEAGFEKYDKILQIDTLKFDGAASINAILSTFKNGDTIKISLERYGNPMEKMLKIQTGTSYNIKLMNANSKELNKDMIEKRSNWLQSK